jgi:hypothetical protein
MKFTKPAASLIAWSLLWALSLIAMAFLLKVNPAASFIEAAINTIGIFVFLVLSSLRNVQTD